MPGLIPSRSDILYQRFANLLALIAEMKNTLPGRVRGIIYELIASGNLKFPHNSTTDIQGGAEGEYYHLTASQLDQALAGGGGGGGFWFENAAGTAGANVVYYLSPPGAYGTLYNRGVFTKNFQAQNDIVLNVQYHMGNVFLQGYVCDQAIGTNKILAGGWCFNIYANVGEPGRACSLFIEVYLIAEDYTETFLFDTQAPRDINFSADPSYIPSWISLQTEFECAPTDRVLIKVYGNSATLFGAMVTLVEGGDEFASYVITPLALPHNSGAFLQGGTVDEYYHLTLDEHDSVAGLPAALALKENAANKSTSVADVDSHVKFPVWSTLRNWVNTNYASRDDLTDGLALKLDISAYNQYFLGRYTSVGALETAHPTSAYGYYAIVDPGTGTNANQYIYDQQDGWVKSVSTSASLSSTDDLPEGSTNLYFTQPRVLTAPLTGLASVTAATVLASDTVMGAIQKIIALIAQRGLPAGGGTGTVLSKLSGADYDYDWAAATGSDSVAINAIGNVNVTSTVTINVSTHVHTVSFSSSPTVTIAFSGWPVAGFKGWVEVVMSNAGLATLVFPSIQWKLINDTFTTTFATYLADRAGETTLKTSGVDRFLFWSDNAGTTVYGTLI